MNRCGKASGARKELGDVVYKIRFPTMAPAEFADIICPTNFLKEREQLEVLRYFSSEKKETKPPLPGIMSSLNMGFSFLGSRQASNYTLRVSSPFTMQSAVMSGFVAMSLTFVLTR